MSMGNTYYGAGAVHASELINMFCIGWESDHNLLIKFAISVNKTKSWYLSHRNTVINHL